LKTLKCYFFPAATMRSYEPVRLVLAES